LVFRMRGQKSQPKRPRRKSSPRHCSTLSTVMFKIIDTEAWSDRYRRAAIDVAGRRLLVTNYLGTDQEKDLSEPANCKGFGRIRHFRRGGGGEWPLSPLPIDPAC
jgi:hypothetical protein